SAAPVFSSEKCPSNFDLRFPRIITVEARGPDDPLSLPIDDDERAAGFQRVSEENSEHLFFVTIPLGMLFPDERIRSDRKQLVPIVRCEWTQLDQFAF